MIDSTKLRRRFRGLRTLLLFQGGAAFAHGGDQRQFVRKFIRDSGVRDRDAFVRWLLEKDWTTLTPEEVFHFVHLCQWVIRVDAQGTITESEFSKVENGRRRSKKGAARRAR